MTLQGSLAPVKFLDLSNFKMKKGRFLSTGARQHIDAVLKEKGKVLVYVQASRGVAGVVEELKGILPGAVIAGYDKASADLPGADVLVATQAVFRHRTRVPAALSVVLDIDWEFHKHDHQAAHGAFALAQHLRQMTQGLVLLQTRHAADPLLQTLSSADARDFYDRELVLRRQMQLPPFAAIATLVVRSADPALACAEAKRLYDMLMTAEAPDVMVLYPQQDRVAVLRGKFRFCISVQGPVRDAVVGSVKAALTNFRGKKDTVVTVSVS
jgi:primosomal protein N'